MNRDRYLLAGDLDAAGVKDWRKRLSDARHADGDGWHRAYDREWAAVKREYYEAAKNWPAGEQHKVVPEAPRRESRPFPGETRMLTYDEVYGESEMEAEQ